MNKKTHPVLGGLHGVRGLLFSVVVSEDVDEAHVVHLALRRICSNGEYLKYCRTCKEKAKLTCSGVYGVELAVISFGFVVQRGYRPSSKFRWTFWGR